MDFVSESDSDNEIIDSIRIPKPRKFQNRPDFLNSLDEDEFIKRFRIGKNSFQFILGKIRDKISCTTER